MAADGEIRFDATMNTDGVKIGAKDIAHAVESTRATAEKASASMAKSIEKFGAAMSSQAKSAEAFEQMLSRAMATVEEEAKKTGVSLESSYAAVRKEAAKTIEAEEAIAKRAGVVFGSDEIDLAIKRHTASQIRETEKVYNAQIAKIQEVQNSMASGASDQETPVSRAAAQDETALDKVLRFTDAVEHGADVAREKVSMLGGAVRDAFKAFEDYYFVKDSIQQSMADGGAQEESAAFNDVAQSAASASSTIDESLGSSAVSSLYRLASSAGRAAVSIAKIAGGAALSFLKKLAAGAKNAAIQLMKLAGHAIQSGIQKLGQLAGGAAKHLLGIGKATHKSSGGFKMGLKTLLKYGLGIRSLFFLFRRLRTAIADGLGEIAKKNPQVAAAVNSLKGALNGLKGSLASAFAPILTAVAPALTTLINLLTTAINTIGAFFAALTGQAYFNKATAAIEATGGAAKSAGGSVKELKRQLAGFDELEILTANDSGGGGGGGGGGGAGSGLSYVNVPIDSAIIDWVAELKKMWENADYEGIGHAIADGINHAFERAKNWISWNNVGGVVTKAVNSIVGIFNGLVDGINWPLIGETFAEGVNTIIKTVTLLQDLDIEGLARGLTSALNRFIQHVEWRELTDTMAFWFNKITNAILTAVETFEWGNAGKTFGASIANLVNKVHWDTIGKTFASLLDGTFVFLRDALAQFDWKDAARKFIGMVNNVVTLPHWDVMGQNINSFMNGVLDFLLTAVRDFDWGGLGTKIRSALQNINWGDIASKVWATIKAAFKGAGDFLSALFGGEYTPKITMSQDQIRNLAQGGGLTQQIANSLGLGNTSGSLGEIGSKLLVTILNAIKGAVSQIPWTDLGIELNKFLKDIEWKDIFNAAWNAFKAAFAGLTEFISAAIYGENYRNSFLWRLTHPNEYREYLSNPDNQTPQQKAIIGAVSRLTGKEPGEEVTMNDVVTGIGNKLGELNRNNENLNALIERGFTIDEAAEFLGLGKSLDKNTKAVDGNTDTIERPDIPFPSESDWEQSFISGWGNLGADTFFWDFLTGNEGQSVDVGVNYYPNGQSPHSPFANTGLGKWLKQITDPKTPVETKVALLKYGWQTIQKFIGTNKPLGALVNLIKNNFANIMRWLFGNDKGNVTAGVYLKSKFGTLISWLTGNNDGTTTPSVNLKSKFGTLLSWLTGNNNGTTTPTVNLASGFGKFLKWVTGNDNGVITATVALVKKKNNTVTWTASSFNKSGVNYIQVAKHGGYITGGMLHSFASGGSINGRGIAKWWGGLPKYASGGRAHGTLFAAGEAGPEIVGHIGGRTEVLNKSQLAQTMYNAVVNGIVTALNGLHFRVPAMATGNVMPYEIAAQIERSNLQLQNTMNANNEDLIQAVTSAVTSQTLAIVAAINALNNGRNQAGGINTQQIIDEINRRTQMYSRSPIMGV